MKSAISVAVNTADTVYVSDLDSVCLVSVSSDRVIRRLERPAHVLGGARCVSVLEQRVLVCYNDKTLVTYYSHTPTSGQVLQTPESLGRVNGITTDNHCSSFLVTADRSVFVLDDKLLWYRIHTGDRLTHDCSVVQSQLWLGYYNGHITVLTSQ